MRYLLFYWCSTGPPPTSGAAVRNSHSDTPLHVNDLWFWQWNQGHSRGYIFFHRQWYRWNSISTVIHSDLSFPWFACVSINLICESSGSDLNVYPMYPWKKIWIHTSLSYYSPEALYLLSRSLKVAHLLLVWFNFTLHLAQAWTDTWANGMSPHPNKGDTVSSAKNTKPCIDIKVQTRLYKC